MIPKTIKLDIEEHFTWTSAYSICCFMRLKYNLLNICISDLHRSHNSLRRFKYAKKKGKKVLTSVGSATTDKGIWDWLLSLSYGGEVLYFSKGSTLHPDNRWIYKEHCWNYTDRWTVNCAEKRVPVPLCPIQIIDGLTWDWMQTSVLRSLSCGSLEAYAVGNASIRHDGLLLELSASERI